MNLRRQHPLQLLVAGSLAATTASAQVVLSDNFEVDTSANYTVVNDGTPDGSATFAFDYVAAGVPLAPRSAAGDLGCLRLTANETLAAVDAYTVFHNTPVVAPHYRLKVDVYMYWDTASAVGTTEFGHVGIGGDGVTFNSVFTPISGSGAFIAFTGDGGSASDFRWFRSAANTPAGDTSSTTLPNSHPSYLGHGSNGTGAFFQSLFPSPPSTIAGSPGNIWTTVEIDVNETTGQISFYFDGQLTFQGRYAGSLAGLVSLGLADTFTSISGAGNATLFDNLEVFIPGPTTSICSQSTNSTTINNGMVACANAGNTTENQWLRRYSPSANCGVVDHMLVSHVNYGIQGATNPSGSQTIFVRAYEIPSGAPLAYGNMTLLSEVAEQIADQGQSLRSVAFPTVACVSPGNDLVLEIASITPIAPGVSFRPAGNDLGQTGPSYIAAAGCGITEPTDLAAIGFPTVCLILDPIYRPNIGDTICSPATANSTGNPARLTAVGCPDAAENDVTLHVADLPLNSTGFFITSRDVNILTNPGGAGSICIASFTIGRYDTSVLNSGATGEVSLALNLLNTPQQPGGPVAVMPGDTRYWQYWYRDTTGGGAATSNFSDAVGVTFQ